MKRYGFTTPIILTQTFYASSNGYYRTWGQRARYPNHVIALAAQVGRSSGRRRTSNIASKRHSTPFRPKQSLSQNFLQDENIIRKIVASFNEARQQLSPTSSVVEVGSGCGAITGLLLSHYEDMLAVEIDSRGVDVLREKHPKLNVLHGDVLDLEWGELSTQRNAPLAVIGNLPYNIVSQILLSMLEAPRDSLGCAVVMMQKEVADRVCAKTRTKAYGILSVVAQLYAKPRLLFDVPSTAFYPRPSVTSTMVLLEFAPAACMDVSNTPFTSALRNVIRTAFQQRRKTLRNSLRTLEGLQVPEEWALKRPEELAPEQFVELTKAMYGERIANVNRVEGTEPIVPVWRPRLKRERHDNSDTTDTLTSERPIHNSLK